MTATVRDFFFRQAVYCDGLGSPFTAFVCRTLGERLDANSAFGARLLGWPGDAEADAAPLRACGALNHLAREGFAPLAPLSPPHALPDADAYWHGVTAAIAAHDARLTAFLDSPPQTNEIGRSAALLFGHAEIAKRTGLPLALLETGASAGLNLLFARYAFDFSAFTWGNAASPVKIRCEFRGNPVALPESIAVNDIRGCDLKPVDASDPKARARMLAYIWPDQTERLLRAAAALELSGAGRASRRTDRRRRFSYPGTASAHAGPSASARPHQLLVLSARGKKGGVSRHDLAKSCRGDDKRTVCMAENRRRARRKTRQRHAPLPLAPRPSRCRVRAGGFSRPVGGVAGRGGVKRRYDQAQCFAEESEL